jgi:hypothetical protein
MTTRAMVGVCSSLGVWAASRLRTLLRDIGLSNQFVQFVHSVPRCYDTYAVRRLFPHNSKFYLPTKQAPPMQLHFQPKDVGNLPGRLIRNYEYPFCQKSEFHQRSTMEFDLILLPLKVRTAQLFRGTRQNPVRQPSRMMSFPECFLVILHGAFSWSRKHDGDPANAMIAITAMRTHFRIARMVSAQTQTCILFSLELSLS